MTGAGAAETSANQKPRTSTGRIVFAIAGAIALVHLLTNSHYGFHRDELQVLSDAWHLAWGYVPYPPFTPFVERISMALFGLSMTGLRLFSVIAQAAAIVVTGLIAKELEGGVWAQATAALAVALSPLPLFEGTEFQYSTFDYLWWVLIAYFAIRLLKSDDARWCVPIGAIIGVGLMTKYTMAFYVAGMMAGLLLTPARRFLATRWFWIGVGVAFVIILPNLIWQARHDFISYTFLKFIHARDVGEGRAEGFWLYQFRINANLCATPFWMAGLFGYFKSRRYRPLAWMYVVPVAIFALSKGRFYYVAAAYPMLFAMGAVVIEGGLSRVPIVWKRSVQAVCVIAIIGFGVYMSLIIVPFASGGRLRDFALRNNGDLREEIGWDELVKNVAAIRDALPPSEQQNFGILVGNYGEQGAIEILGQAYHLPPPISGTNSAWLRGYPTPPPSTLIVIGHSQKWVNKWLTDCRVAGHNGNSLGVHNEEADDHPDIFVCGGPQLPWPEFWKHHQWFG